MATEGIRIPVEIDLGAMEALTQDLPAAAREAGQQAGEALGDGLESGTKDADKALDKLNKSIAKNTKAALDGAEKIQAELEDEIKTIRKTAEGFEEVADVQAKVKKAIASATRASKKRMEALESSTEKASKRLNALGEVGEKVGRLPGVGRMGSLVGGLAASFGALLTPAGLAVAAVAAVGAALLAGVAAGVAFVAGLGSIIHGYEDLVDAIKPLEDMGLGLDQEEIDSFGRAKAGMDSLWVIGKGLALTWASQFTPAVEAATTVLVAIGLAALDAFKVFAEGQDPVKNTFKEIGKAIFAPTRILNDFIQAHIILADLLGIKVPKVVRKAATGLDKLQESFEAMPYSAARTGWKGVEMSLGSYMDKAGELITTQKAINDEIWKGKEAAIAWVDIDLTPEIREADKATQDLAATWAKFAIDRSSASDQVWAKYQAQIDQVQGLIDKGGDRVQGQQLINMLIDEMNIKLAETDPLYESHEQRLKRIKDRHAEIKVVQDTAVDATMQGLAAFNSLAQTSFQSRMAAYEDVKATHADLDRELTDAEVRHEANLKAAAKRAWKWQQGLAVAQAIAQGAVAAVQAFAQLGPIAGAIAAGGIILTTIAASVATIKAQKPEFSKGGIVGSYAADSMGRVAATVEANEAVLNQRAVASIGTQGVHNLNAGVGAGTGGGMASASINFRDAPLDQMMFRLVQGPGRFADLIRSVTSPRSATMVMA